MAGDDPRYRAWLLLQPCSCQPCSARVEVHHSTVGAIVAPGEPSLTKSTGRRRGKAQRASDYYGIPLCAKHHAQFHALAGYFRGWTKATLRTWQESQVAENRAVYEGQKEAEEEPGFPLF